MAGRVAVSAGTVRGRALLKEVRVKKALGDALIVLRMGNAIEGKVLEKFFTIDTGDLEPLKVPTAQLASIIMKNLPNFPLDVMRFPNGYEISGVVLTDPVRVKSKQVGKVTIELEKILSILF